MNRTEDETRISACNRSIDFSIVMPVFNREDTVADALASIHRQLLAPTGSIVIDDGSSDNSVEVVKSFDSVKVISQLNAGPGEARNRGVSHAGAEYIAFLDSDDCYFPWTLSVYRDAISRYDFPAILTGSPVCFSTIEELDDVCELEFAAQRFVDYFSTGERWLWHGVSSFVIRRDVFRDAGGFASGRINGEDAELLMRLGTAKGFVHISSPPMFGYRVHDGNVTLDRVKSKQGLELLIRGEREGRFPGGRERAKERATIISRHVRPFAISSANEGDWRTAFQMYRAVLAEAVRKGRFRFLIGLPILAVAGWVRQSFGRRTV